MKIKAILLAALFIFIPMACSDDDVETKDAAPSIEASVEAGIMEGSVETGTTTDDAGVVDVGSGVDSGVVADSATADMSE